MWRKIKFWLEQRGLLAHRHRYYVAGIYVKGVTTRGHYERRTYFAEYVCEDCGNHLIEATLHGQAHQEKHGDSRVEFTYVPFSLGGR